MLEGVYRGYVFPIEKFVLSRLPNVATDPWEGIKLWSQRRYTFSLPKQEAHVLIYIYMYSESNPEGADSPINPKLEVLRGIQQEDD